MSTDVHILAAHPRLRRVLLVCVVIVAVVLAGRAVGAAVGLVRPIVVPLGIALLLTGLLMPVRSCSSTACCACRGHWPPP